MSNQGPGELFNNPLFLKFQNKHVGTPQVMDVKLSHVEVTEKLGSINFSERRNRFESKSKSEATVTHRSEFQLERNDNLDDIVNKRNSLTKQGEYRLCEVPFHKSTWG